MTNTTAKTSAEEKYVFIEHTIQPSAPGNFLPQVEEINGLTLSPLPVKKGSNPEWRRFQFKATNYIGRKLIELAVLRWLAEKAGCAKPVDNKTIGKGVKVEYEKLKLNWDGFKLEVA